MGQSQVVKKGLFALLFSMILAGPACNCDGDPTPDASTGQDVIVYDSGLVDTSNPDVVVIDGAGQDSAQADSAESDSAVMDAASVDVTSTDVTGIDGAELDAGAMDAAESDAAELDAGPSPVSPVLTSPSEGAEVHGEVQVTGTGTPGEEIHVVILTDLDETLGTAQVTVDANGEFSVLLSYSGADNNAPLTVSVTQQNAVGSSAPVTVGVIHTSIFTLSGTLSQTGNTFFGDKVYVRLYASATEFLHPLAEQVVDVTVGQRLPSGTPFSFAVSDGNYHLRAFRDSFGPLGQFGQSPLPDGQPTLGADDQAPGLAVTVAGADSSGHNLDMDSSANQDDRFFFFMAYTINESAEASPPYYSSGQDWLPGEGLCGGYYLRFDTRAADGANPDNMSAPMVQGPDGSNFALLNDSGCTSSVHDNTSMSYDENEDPNSYSYGIPDPTEGMVGDYTFFYRQLDEDLIHIQVDNIAQMTKLDRRVIVTAPTGATANANLRPTITWEPIAGAGAYQVSVESIDGSYRNDADNVHNVVTSPSYSFPAAVPSLTDDLAYRVRITIWDVDPTAGGDFDAIAYGTENAFMTDVDGANSVLVSGSLTNNSNGSGRVQIFGQLRENHNDLTVATLWMQTPLPASYQLMMPTDPHNTPCDADPKTAMRDCVGTVYGFIDSDASGELWGAQSYRQPYHDEARALDLRNNVNGADLRFTEPVLLLSPVDGASDVASHVDFVWQDYATSAAGFLPTGPWSYILFYTRSFTDGLPEAVWGLPSTTTHFDMSAPPADPDKYDVINLASQGQTPSLAQLQSGDWTWTVLVLECDYQAYLDNTDADDNGSDDYTDCLNEVLGNDGAGYASSASWSFTMP